LSKPKISIITVVYNGQEYLEQTIRSVLGQSCAQVEYIIIDGGSSDGSVDIIKRYEDRIAYWVSEKDAGIYDAMNKGLRHANGELIAFLNASDWYYDENVLSRVAELSRQYPDADAFFGALQYEDMICGTSRLVPAPRPWSDALVEYTHPSAFVRSHVFDILQFNTAYPVAADREFFIRMQRAGMKMHAVGAVFTCFRSGGMSAGEQVLYDNFCIDRAYFGWPYAVRSLAHNGLSWLGNAFLPAKLLCWQRALKPDIGKEGAGRS